MRFTIALALSFASTALHAAGAGALAVRQQCTVACACLDQNRNRFWEATERCCRPNGGEPDTPPGEYCRRIPFETAETGFGGCCGGGLFECRQQICS
ncbi:hypothetical protein DL770_003539 [Monosporascus sp. CRB-9-2]|nr:hypothetical protein DL770_003539 [Monosporascus sp. CRB-9-2]